MNSEQQCTPVDRPSGPYQEYTRGQIKKFLLSEDILVNIFADWYILQQYFAFAMVNLQICFPEKGYGNTS